MSSPLPVELLLVEDDPHDVELTLRSLKKAQITNSIQVVRDGEEALEFLLGEGSQSRMEKPPRLILLDLKLPKIDGLEVLRRIKADPSTKKVPVVVLSSSREHTDLREAYDAGANSYIVKPVDFEQFFDAVKDLGFYWLLLNERPG